MMSFAMMIFALTEFDWPFWPDSSVFRSQRQQLGVSLGGVRDVDCRGRKENNGLQQIEIQEPSSLSLTILYTARTCTLKLRQALLLLCRQSSLLPSSSYNALPLPL